VFFLVRFIAITRILRVTSMIMLIMLIAFNKIMNFLLIEVLLVNDKQSLGNDDSITLRISIFSGV